jgi:hypothetical protein
VTSFNVDNGDLNAVADSIQAFANGVATYSLPSGHYFAVGEFLQVDPNNPVLPDAARLDVLPQFTVDADTTVDMSAAAASSKLAMVTPRGATPESSDFGVLRTAVAGPASQLFVTALGGQIWVSPTSARPSVGQLTGYAAQQLASPPGPGTPYRYELSYADPPGTIPPQTYHVQPASLETITDTFYADIPVSGQWSQYGTAINALPPGAGYINPVPSPLSLPGRQTRYVGGNVAATAWSDYYDMRNAAGDFLGTEFEYFSAVRPGARLTDSWNQYPLHPGANVNPDPESVYNGSLPSASREGDTLTVSVVPFDDNQPGHYSSGTTGIDGATTSATYRVTQDGTTVASGAAPIGPSGGIAAVTAQAALRPGASVISLEVDASQTGPSFPLSTRSKTTWTWRSSHESGATVPQGWFCADDSASPDCRAEPMMTLQYHVHGMALNGTAAAGPQVLDLAAGHIQPLASPAAVTGAGVQVSFDDGRTWHAAHVTSLSHGNYRVTYTAPAGSYVTLRTTVTDAAGGSITEAITRGYRIAG